MPIGWCSSIIQPYFIASPPWRRSFKVQLEIELGIPCKTRRTDVLIVGDMNLKNIKLLSLALSFRMKRSSKPWRIDTSWCYISLMGDNSSGSLSWTTLLNSSNMSFIFSVISMYGGSDFFDHQSKSLLCLFWFHQKLTLVAYGYELWLFWTQNKWNRLHNQIIVIKRFCFTDSHLRFLNESNTSLNTSTTHLIVGCHVNQWCFSLNWLLFNWWLLILLHCLFWPIRSHERWRPNDHLFCSKAR